MFQLNANLMERNTDIADCNLTDLYPDIKPKIIINLNLDARSCKASIHKTN